MKRKVNKLFLSIGLSFLIVVAFSSCDLILNLGNGTLEIDFGSITGKSINWLPDINMNLDHYTITATGPNEDDSFLVEDFSGSLFVKESLSVGEWSITIDGFNKEGVKVGTTTFSTTIKKSQTTSVSAEIKPLEGVGDLNVSISWTDSQNKMKAPSASITIRDDEGEIVLNEVGNEVYTDPISLTINAETKTATGLIENLPNGYYEVTTKLLEGIPNSEAEVVWQGVHNLRVVKDETTEGEAIITEEEIDFGLGQLSANIIDGMNNPFGLSFTTLPDSVKEEDVLTVVAAGEYSDEASFRWYVNGVKQVESSNTFIFTPNMAGIFKISLLVNDNGAVSGYRQSVQVLKAAEEVSLDTASLEIQYSPNETATSVLNNIILPTQGANGTRITWQSNNENCISNDGTVTRPAYSSGDSSVQLIATVERGTAKETKTFDLTVIKLLQTDREAVTADKTSLEIGFTGLDTFDNVTQDLTLKTSGECGTTVTWQSSNIETIDTTGIVTRPNYTVDSDIQVTLTATITKGEISETKTFDLVVKIVLQEQTVTYISNEGSSIEPQTVYWGRLIEEPTSPTRVGYSFEGWFTDTLLTNQWNFDTDYVDGDITLYAKWADGYTVTFDNQGGLNPEPSSVKVGSGVPYGSLATTAKVGHTFLGWYTEPLGNGSLVETESIVTINKDHTLYASWQANTQQITFNPQGGNLEGPKTVGFTYNQPYGELATPTREKHSFAGWWIDELGKDKEIKAETKMTYTSDKTLYAKWVFDVYLGDTGGLVFYENPNWETDGWRYLEAAPEGWYTGATDSSGDYNPAHGDPRFEWGAYGYSVSPSAQATGIGTGKTNTDNIVTYHDLLWQSYEDKGDYYTNPTEYHERNDGTVAAKVCQEYSIEVKGETYNDWFLPSKDELNLIYENLYKQGLGGFSGNYYWSSSEDNVYSAWLQHFNGGNQYNSNRDSRHGVRPIRAFN